MYITWYLLTPHCIAYTHDRANRITNIAYTVEALLAYHTSASMIKVSPKMITLNSICPITEV